MLYVITQTQCFTMSTMFHSSQQNLIRMLYVITYTQCFTAFLSKWCCTIQTHQVNYSRVTVSVEYLITRLLK